MHLTSQKNVEKVVPTTSKMKQLYPWANGGYVCGNEVKIEGFVMMRKLWCGHYVESRYYNSLGSAKNGGRGGPITEDVCAIWFYHNKIVSRDKMIKMRDVGEKIRLKYEGIVLILYWKSQHLEVLVIRYRRKSISTKKEETLGKGGGVWYKKGEKSEVRSSVSELVIHCVLCHIRL